MAIQRLQSRGRISIVKIQNFTIERRHSVILLVYGFLMVTFGLVLATINPLDLVTNWFLAVREGSFVVKMWENPSYEIFCDVYIFNYTNAPQYLNGEDKVLKITELGPFRYRENRTNQNMTLDWEKGVMKMIPNINLTFVPEESTAAPEDLMLSVPNIALIAISTIAADRLGYLANAGAYYSMTALGSKLFLNITAQDYMWGYHDPIVTIANSILPGWIDFGKIGIMDRFYGVKMSEAVVQVGNPDLKYAIETWDGSEGLVEQGYTDMNTSSLCNRVKGAYEGMMVSSATIRSKEIRIFRKQACRIYPFVYKEDILGDAGFYYSRFMMEQNAFNKNSSYACECKKNCLPDGFIDISECYYGFPIALSKPHFIDVDPSHKVNFEGMRPDPLKHDSFMDFEPVTGAPVQVRSNCQVNIAVRTSAGNPITRPVKDKILPLIWVSLFCREPPPVVLTILRLRFVIAPPLIITLIILLFTIGFILGVQGFYRIMRPKYRLIEPAVVPRPRRRKSSVCINVSDNRGFKDDDEMAKEAVSLLAIKEEDVELPDLIMTD